MILHKTTKWMLHFPAALALSLQPCFSSAFASTRCHGRHRHPGLEEEEVQNYSSSGEPPNLLPLSSTPEWTLCFSHDFHGLALLVLAGRDSASGMFIGCLRRPDNPAIGPCCFQGLPSTASPILRRVKPPISKPLSLTPGLTEASP